MTVWKALRQFEPRGPAHQRRHGLSVHFILKSPGTGYGNRLLRCACSRGDLYRGCPELRIFPRRNVLPRLRRASGMGVHGPASIDRVDGLAAGAYDRGLALCAAAITDAGRCGLHRDDRSVGPQAGGRPLGDVSGFACGSGCANLPGVFTPVYDECFRSAPVDADCMVSCRSCSDRQRAKLDLDRSFDRHYAAQQIWRAVFYCWSSGRSCVFAIAPQSCTSVVLGRGSDCHADRAAEFPLATALEFSLCAIGKKRAEKMGAM